jgi:hypothetical protein
MLAEGVNHLGEAVVEQDRIYVEIQEKIDALKGE